MPKIRITPAVAEEYELRELAACYEGDHNAYAKIAGPGAYDLTEGEARELLADAGLYTDAGGPGYYLTVGQRGAYRSLAKQIRKALTVAG